jgi:hypothetical protein
MDHGCSLCMSCLRISVIPRISRQRKIFYVANRGQTAPSPQLIGLLNLINASKAFSAFSATAVKARCPPERKDSTKVVAVRYSVYNRPGCFVLVWWSRSMAGRLADALIAGMARNKVWYVRRRGVKSALVGRMNKAYVLIRNIVNIREHTRRIRKTVVIHGNKE